MIGKPIWRYLFAMIVLASAVPATCSVAAPTSFTSIDNAIYGPGSLTRDRTTGLEWLDWSLTKNRAVSDVAGQLGPGGEFAGFRYATKDEIIDLFWNAGFTSLDHFTPTPPGTVADYQAAVNFVELFGTTASSTNVFASRAFLGPGSYPFPGFHVEVLVSYSLLSGRGFAGANGGLVEPVGIGDGPSSITGHALVRPVPEPSGWVLIVMSMSAIGTLCRRAGRN